MTEKEFDLLISMILEMLKNGQTEQVIRLLEESKHNKDKQRGVPAAKVTPAVNCQKQ